MKTCLFGGSFDPVHAGHMAIAGESHAACGLDRVVFLPAACSPFKTGRKTMFDDAARMRMLLQATQGLDWAEVSDLDLTLPPPSWSWRIVERWKQLHPQDELYWLLGTDQWNELHRWGRYDYLCEQLRFIVYHRKTPTPPQPRPGVRAIFLEGDHPASSSAIRQALLAGTPVPASWIPTGVHYSLPE